MWLCSEELDHKTQPRINHHKADAHHPLSIKGRSSNEHWAGADRFEHLLVQLKEVHFLEVSSLRIDLESAHHKLKRAHKKDDVMPNKTDKDSASSAARGARSSYHRGSIFRKGPVDDVSSLDEVPREHADVEAPHTNTVMQVFVSNIPEMQMDPEPNDDHASNGALVEDSELASKRASMISFAAADPELASKRASTYNMITDDAAHTNAEGRNSMLSFFAGDFAQTSERPSDLPSEALSEFRCRPRTTVRGVSTRLSAGSALSFDTHFESAKFNLWPVWTTHMPLTGSTLWRNAFEKNESYASTSTMLTDSIRTKKCKVSLIANPSAPGRFLWDMIALFLVLFDFVTIPLQVFEVEDNPVVILVMRFATIFWTGDIFASFSTGFYKNGDIVMDRKRIAANYMRTWFVPDVVVVAADWMMLLASSSEGAGGAVSSLRFTKFARFLRTIRLMRLGKTKKILNDIKDRIDSDYLNAVFKIFTLLTMIVGVNHVVACTWYGLSTWPTGRDGWVMRNGLELESKEYLYFVSLHWSMTQFTPASMSIQPSDLLERIFAVVVILFALVIFSSFLSSLTNATSALRNLKEEESRNISQLRRYMGRCAISRSLRLRIERYAEYVLKSNMNQIDVTDVKLLKLLSHPLRNELYTELYMESLQCYGLFIYLDLHQALTLRICCTALGPMHLARADVLFFGGEVAKDVFIVAWGDLQYRSRMDVNTFDVERNSWVADQLIWTSWIHMGDMRAVTVATIVQIDPTKFATNFKSLPMIWAEAARYGQEYVAQLNLAVQEGVEVNDIDTSFFDMTKVGLRKSRSRVWGARLSEDSELEVRRSWSLAQQRIGGISAKLKQIPRWT